jgi:hypothetical protein
MYRLFAAVALLLFTITSLEARTLGFTAEFPDERLRGSAYSLSDSDYADAWSQGSAILRKNAEIYEYVRISRESTEAKIQTFNRLRRENNERMERLYAFVRSRGTRVR